MYSRHENKKTERIGKKYQWIAFYNILARVSDTHLLKDWNESPHPYEGTLDPYVRDFDPTLNVNFLKLESLPAIQYPQLSDELFLQTEPFPSETQVQEWTRSPTSFFESLPDKLVLVDVDGTQWVNLNFYDNTKSEQFKSNSIGFSKGSQEIWLTAHSFFVEPDTFEILKKKPIASLSAADFSRGLEVYQLFNREYSWSSGYQSIFQPNFFETEIEIGEKKLIKEIVDVPAFIYQEEGEFEFKVTKKEIERLVPTEVIRVKVMPTYSHLLWEGEYDASQKDTTSFDVPCKGIIDYFHLEQKESDGYYFDSDGVLVCFDASLSGICDGLLIRKEYLEQFMAATGLKLFWQCTGEKQFFQGECGQIWQRWEGLFNYEQGEVLGDLKCCEED